MQRGIGVVVGILVLLMLLRRDLQAVGLRAVDRRHSEGGRQKDKGKSTHLGLPSPRQHLVYDSRGAAQCL